MTEQEKKKQEGYLPKGSDEATYSKANTPYVQSEGVTSLQGKSSGALSNYESIASKDGIISEGTKGAMSQQYKTPTAVSQADAYLRGALSKIQSGKTSYSDQVRDMISQIQGRDKFSYDVDKDPLFQQALASAMNSGRSAMQDTIGQASALTGGYGSSYATSAANQAYNAFIEDAYDNLPQYYQMALDAYQSEGDEMYRQLGMLTDADEREYGRLINAFDATSAYRNQAYNEAYQQFRDSKSDAFTTANLEMSEHSQRASDAFNLYGAYVSEAEAAYAKEYQSWADSVEQAWKMIGMQNQDYWAQTEFDEGVRQYNQNFTEEQRRYNETMAFNKEQAKLDEDYRWATFEEQKKQNEADNKYRDRAMSQSVYEFAVTHGDKDGNGVLTPDEIAAYNAADKDGNGASPKYSLDDSEINKIEEIIEDNGGVSEVSELAVLDYLEQKGKMPATDEQMKIVQSVYMNSDGNLPTSSPAQKAGSVSKFRTAEGDNFDITIDGKTYGVKNHGKVDNKTKEELDKLSITDETAFAYNGEIYVKYAGGYYLVGAKALHGGTYDDALKALK